jgi:hypothetical protein
MRYIIAVMNVTAKIPFPRKIVRTCAGNQRLLKMGLTVISTAGIVADRIIRNAANGAMKEPRIINLNLR